MKKLKSLSFLFLVLISTAFRAKSPISYSVDAAKSKIKWTGYAEAGGYAPTGTINIKSGTVTLDSGALLNGKAVIDMGSLSQSNEEMQTHLKGSDFFDVAKYPEALFALSSATDNTANGKLTIRGITQPVSFPFTLSKTADGLILKAKLKVDRTKFEIKYNSKTYFQDLGSYAIKNDFDLEITLVLKP